jgi:hypothetical protein
VSVRKSDNCPTSKQKVQFGPCEDLLTMLSRFCWNVNGLWLFLLLKRVFSTKSSQGVSI